MPTPAHVPGLRRKPRLVSVSRDEDGEIYFVGYQGMICKMKVDGALFE